MKRQFQRQTYSPYLNEALKKIEMNCSVLFLFLLFCFPECSLTSSRVDLGSNLRITTILAEPFMFEFLGLNNSTKKIGLVKDILDALSDRMNFTYDLYPVPDGNYGTMDASGVWNGAVAELLNHRADMVAADLTVNAERSEARIGKFEIIFWDSKPVLLLCPTLF